MQPRGRRALRPVVPACAVPAPKRDRRCTCGADESPRDAACDATRGLDTNVVAEDC